MSYIGPKCPECGKNLRISKLEFRRWICGKCNTIYEDDVVNNKKSDIDKIDEIINGDKNGR